MQSMSVRSLVVLVILVVAGTRAAEACTPTGFIRNGNNLTAVLINPPYVTFEVDATGCDIGVWFSAGVRARVEDADIHGARYFGVVVRSARACRSATIA